MTVKNNKPETLVMTKELLKSVKSARIRYDEYLSDQKKEKNLSEMEKQLKAMTVDIVTMKNKKSALEKTSDTLTKVFEKLMDKAEKKMAP